MQSKAAMKRQEKYSIKDFLFRRLEMQQMKYQNDTKDKTQLTGTYHLPKKNL
jgi:hypothetical protein